VSFFAILNHMKTVMVFGTFDGIHEGHRAMLKEARSLGDRLIVVVAQDHIIEHIKGELPRVNLLKRFEHLQRKDYVDEVVIGDSELGVWHIVRSRKPNLIAVGHDQQALHENLLDHYGELGCRPELVLLSHYEVSKERTYPRY